MLSRRSVDTDVGQRVFLRFPGETMQYEARAQRASSEETLLTGWKNDTQELTFSVCVCYTPIFVAPSDTSITPRLSSS